MERRLQMITKTTTEYEVGDVFVRDQNGAHGIYICTAVRDGILVLEHMASNTQTRVNAHWINGKDFKYRYNFNRDKPVGYV